MRHFVAARPPEPTEKREHPTAGSAAGSAATLGEYAALRLKVDGFAAAVTARRGADLKCQSGCAACCHVQLTVSPVEAAAITAQLTTLPAEARAALRQGLERPSTDRRCVMLLSDDTCAIYPARPLVCRSQGLPLSYSPEQVPEEARLGLLADGRALTCCPLNFTDPARPPRSEDALDGERVDVLLSLVNRRFVSGAEPDTSPLARYALADLAREFVE